MYMSQVQKDIRITHLNYWSKNLINKYIDYKSNLLSTFTWLEPVLTPALDIGMAKSGSSLVHIHPSNILCLIPCVKARKTFHGVLPCLVMMYHQTNLACKSFIISEDLSETIVALTLNLWPIQVNIHWSSEPPLWPWPWIQQSNLFTRQSSLWTWTVKLSWPPKKSVVQNT